jgi:hypothetical protein
MTLRVPTNKAESVGMRKLSSDKTLRDALETLKGKPKVKRTMWSRRAQEYEAKINSGDLISIAEVTRDLFRADDQPEQSYSSGRSSKRLPAASRELAAMEEVDEPGGSGEDPRDPQQGRGHLQQGQGARLSFGRALNIRGRPVTGRPSLRVLLGRAA